MIANMSIHRDSVGVGILGDRLFAIGGYDGQTYLSLVEMYDPVYNKWKQVCVPSSLDKIEILIFQSMNL